MLRSDISKFIAELF